ncbi:hypothetical protein VHUM_04156 [Vanrija humicola]|uniref:Major facilitator superfamily (MFS) profile domain-containing protein n=1 Tax=Vanrija humicola TaxID=5417 RepID=A0A7D8YZE3_VANHU|nr:hypothetical protein VHUM_04156 [Vanrija humicola]
MPSPSPSAPRAPPTYAAAVAGERTPLLAGSGPKPRRESIAAYATGLPDTAETPVVPSSRHYNLAGLSQTDFWILCISMWWCSFLSAFDGTIVATLLGPISSSFLASNNASWLGTSYLLSVCCFTPIYGRLCNIIGRQASMLVSLFFFSLGNIMCAVAPSMQFLIAARAIAGIGGGGLTSVGSTIMSDLVPITHRGIFQGYGNIMFGMGSGLGAPLGGIISDRLGWRWAFYLQIPLLVLAASMVYLKVTYTVASPSSSGASTPARTETALQKLGRIDWLGSFLMAGFLGSSLVAVSLRTSSTSEDGTELYSWSDPLILGLFATSAVLLVAFLYVELRVAKEPVLPVELLTRRTPVAIAINNFVISFLTFALMYSVPLYFTAVRLMSSEDAGAHLIPNSVLGSFGSLATGFIVRATGRYYWLTIFCGSCSIVSTLLLSSWSLDTSEWLMWTSFGPQAFSMGSVTTLTIVALIADVGRDHVAVATSLSYVFRTTGQVLGVALSGALTQAVLQRELVARITGPNADKVISSIRQSSEHIRTLPPALQLAARTSYLNALHAVFFSGIAFSVVGVLASAFIREVPMGGVAKVPDSESDEEA